MHNTTRPRTIDTCVARSTANLMACAAVACFTVALTAPALLPHRAVAQDSARPCTEIDSDAERLACYDRALRPARPATAVAPSAAQPAPVPTALGEQLSTAREAEPRAARTSRSEAPAAPAAPASPGAPAAAPAVAAPAARNEIVPIVIVGVRALAGRNDNVFTTDGGSVWIQTDNAQVQLPDPPFEAQIKPGAMGSYFLVLGERNRGIRVRRGN